MATHLCALTAVRGRSTGGGSDPPKLLARWTVGGEEGRGRRSGGWAPSLLGPLLGPLPPCCLHLLGQVPYSGDIQTPPAISPSPKHTPFYSSKGYSLSTPDMPGSVKKAVLGSHFHSHSYIPHIKPLTFPHRLPSFLSSSQPFAHAIPSNLNASLHYLLWVTCFWLSSIVTSVQGALPDC